MTLQPGGLAWLVRHELRLAMRGTGTRGGWARRTIPLVLLAALPAIGGVALAWVFAAAERNSGPLPASAAAPLYGLLGFVVLAVFAVMLSTAAIAVLRTFNDRGDLDLLLSAPVPATRVLRAKTFGVVIGVAAPFLVLVAPFTIASAIFGHPARLGGLAMIVVTALFATANGLAVTAVLLDTVGPRRARIIVQVAAALSGAAAFLLTQLPNIAPAAGHSLARLIETAPPAIGWVGRAAGGEVVPLTSLLAGALAAIGLATRYATRHLAASADRGTARAAVRVRARRFTSGLTRIVVVKELRLIVRDPELITQVAMRLVYLVPLAALVLRGSAGIDSAGVAGAVAGFAGLLASSLAWIIVCGEDAPDLLASAPAAAPAVARGKLIAAGVFPGMAVGVAAAALVPAAPATAAVTLTLGAVAVVTATSLQAWFGRPASRSAFRRRQPGSFAVGVGEVVLAGAWSGTATLLARGSGWALAPALLGGIVMAGAIEARRDA